RQLARAIQSAKTVNEPAVCLLLRRTRHLECVRRPALTGLLGLAARPVPFCASGSLFLDRRRRLDWVYSRVRLGFRFSQREIQSFTQLSFTAAQLVPSDAECGGSFAL